MKAPSWLFNVVNTLCLVVAVTLYAKRWMLASVIKTLTDLMQCSKAVK